MSASTDLLTIATGTLLSELLAWDRARIAKVEAGGVPCPQYRARQDAAEAAAVGTPPAAWPPEVREVYQALIEVRWYGDVRRTLYRDAAVEIGADAALRPEVPGLFSDAEPTGAAP